MTTTQSKAPLPMDLFGPLADVRAGTKEDVIYVELVTIEVDPDQPRTDVDAELEFQIKAAGRIIQPLKVRSHPDAKKRENGILYQLTHGERRYWGAIKAGLTTVPVIVDDRPQTPLQRKIEQAIDNSHRRLPPMDEARLFKTIQDETGWSEQQIADVTGYKKSTIADRLALVNAPEAFQALFLDGTLSAAAAPIVRKFFGVPENILEMAARTAPADLAWQTAKRAGKPVELKDVGRVLDKIILEERMRELPEALVLLYQGPRCKVAGAEYAVDIPQFLDAQRKHEAELRRKEIEKAKPLAEAGAKKPLGERSFHERDAIKTVGGLGALGGETDEEDDDASSPSESVRKAASAATPARSLGPTAAERKRQQQIDRDREAEARKKAAWEKSKGKVLVAIANALAKAKADAKSGIAEYLMELIANSTGVDYPNADKLVGRGKSAEEFLRFLVMASLQVDVVEDFNVEGLPRRLRELGLRVDLQKILDTTAKEIAGARSPADATREFTKSVKKAAAKTPAKKPAKKAPAKKPSKTKASKRK